MMIMDMSEIMKASQEAIAGYPDRVKTEGE